ncbi:MAG: 3-deoxy-7-phosphoheptulonate synthase [Planctomycetaceae bacterium]|nr:3-deoxy-7-phosphoheptulonate synthase [Planctomycetaceae bacterium]
MNASLPVQDVNVLETTPLVAPAVLKQALPLSDEQARFVVDAREQVKQILTGQDDRVIAIVGPCSIHNPDIAIEYARKLAEVSRAVSKRLLVVMRVYFEKPRTTTGWKGLINDPGLNDTFDMAGGLKIAREILLEVTRSGLPAATEMLEPITPQYISDLITIGSIGARTTESQTHRQMASGLSMPVGFKNSTEGSFEIAINAMKAASAPHRFLGIDHEGKTCLVHTRGNDMAHMILRGGRTGPNYDADSVAQAAKMLKDAGLPQRFVVDCSHANSNKDYTRQPEVWNNVIAQRAAGNDAIVGLMLESNLNEGKQSLGDDPAALKYGVSITDGCISFDQTAELLMNAFEQLGG